jgi:hypothetical protein
MKDELSATEILKTDLRGRVRTPRGVREKILEEFDRSGMRAAGFAALVGIKHQTFPTWVQKRRKRAGAAAEGRQQIMEATVRGGTLRNIGLAR